LKARKIHVWPSQAETTNGKNVIIGESREKVRPTTKKSKPSFDEPSTKYKKGNTHIKSSRNRNVRKVKPELPISPCQADFPVVGRRGDSKQPKSSLQRPSYVVRIGESGNFIQQHSFLLLNIQSPNPRDLLL
jgi:hypothetical protein